MAHLVAEKVSIIQPQRKYTLFFINGWDGEEKKWDLESETLNFEYCLSHR